MKRLLISAILAILVCLAPPACSLEPDIELPDTLVIKHVYVPSTSEILLDKAGRDVCPKQPQWDRFAQRLDTERDLGYAIWRVGVVTTDPTRLGLEVFLKHSASHRIIKKRADNVACLCD